LSYVGFVPLGDFVDMLGDKKNDFGWHFIPIICRQRDAATHTARLQDPNPGPP
jgi:hypothetical protein